MLTLCLKLYWAIAKGINKYSHYPRDFPLILTIPRWVYCFLLETRIWIRKCQPEIWPQEYGWSILRIGWKYLGVHTVCSGPQPISRAELVDKELVLLTPPAGYGRSMSWAVPLHFQWDWVQIAMAVTCSFNAASTGFLPSLVLLLYSLTKAF